MRIDKSFSLLKWVDQKMVFVLRIKLKDCTLQKDNNLKRILKPQMKPYLEDKRQTSQFPTLNQTKPNIKRNLSVRSGKSNTQTKPKSPSKLNDNKKQTEKSYIAKSFANIDNGCYDQKNGQLKIDGDYGDYRMKMFRKKDKAKHYNDPTSIFSDKQFTQKIWEYANSGLNQNSQTASKQLKIEVQQPFSPMQKRAARMQRARIGFKRQNSILSPGLKPVQMQKGSFFGLPHEQNSQLNNKLNDILSKSPAFYLYQPIQNEQVEEDKNMKKGIEQQLRQKQGHLFHRSIPQYMAQKWFKTLDNSTKDGNYVTPYVQPKLLPAPVKRLQQKRTHLFRFLQQSCKFGMKKTSKQIEVSSRKTKAI